MNKPHDDKHGDDAGSSGSVATPKPFKLILSPAAKRALSENLPAAAAFAAWEFITGPLTRNPHRVGAALRAPLEGMWRARRGEYRVRYRIDDERHEVYVLDIDHRRDAYHQ